MRKSETYSLLSKKIGTFTHRKLLKFEVVETDFTFLQ